jgi:DNA-binding NarL/FixJ family response regulator
VQPGQAGVRVVVADDDVLLREGLASLLTRSGYQVVGQAGDATTLLELVRSQTPELAIVDIRMPPTCSTDGLDAAMVIRAEMPKVGLVILSAHVDVEHALQVLASDRSVGYLLKTRITDVGDFLDTLGRIADGACVIDPALVQELVDARRRNDPLAAARTRIAERANLRCRGRSERGIGRSSRARAGHSSCDLVQRRSRSGAEDARPPVQRSGQPSARARRANSGIGQSRGLLCCGRGHHEHQSACASLRDRHRRPNRPVGPCAFYSRRRRRWSRQR